jgi:hypothetical protein
MKSLIILAWVGVILGCVAAVFVGVTGMAAANGAPQEAVVLCLALALAVIPYCGARALTEICHVSDDDKPAPSEPPEAASPEAKPKSGYNYESIIGREL